MQNRVRTIWVTGLTLIALLLSGVSVSAPLMTSFQIADSQAMTFVSDHDNSGCGSFQKSSMVSETECCNTDSSVPDHQCCPATCVAGYLMVSQVIGTNHQISNIVPIPLESVEHANSVASTLYRPPII